VPQQKSSKRKSLKGALAGTVPTEVIDDFIQGLNESKAERRACFVTWRCHSAFVTRAL
jgi:hypothetical protein